MSHVFGDFFDQVQIARPSPPAALCDGGRPHLLPQCKIEVPLTPVEEFRVLAQGRLWCPDIEEAGVILFLGGGDAPLEY